MSSPREDFARAGDCSQLQPWSVSLVETAGDPQLGTSQFSEAGSKSSVLTKQQMLLWDLSSVLGGWWRAPCSSWGCFWERRTLKPTAESVVLLHLLHPDQVLQGWLPFALLWAAGVNIH